MSDEVTVNLVSFKILLYYFFCCGNSKNDHPSISKSNATLNLYLPSPHHLLTVSSSHHHLITISSPYNHHIITISSPYHHHIITISSPHKQQQQHHQQKIITHRLAPTMKNSPSPSKSPKCPT
jgi:hypothetical protein